MLLMFIRGNTVKNSLSFLKSWRKHMYKSLGGVPICMHGLGGMIQNNENKNSIDFSFLQKKHKTSWSTNSSPKGKSVFT